MNAMDQDLTVQQAVTDIRIERVVKQMEHLVLTIDSAMSCVQLCAKAVHEFAEAANLLVVELRALDYDRSRTDDEPL